MMRYPKEKSAILTCPDCGFDNVEQIEPHGYQWKNIFVDDEACMKAYKDAYGDLNRQEPQFTCHNCFDNWYEGEYDETNNKYWSPPKGLAPLSKMTIQKIMPLKDPGIDKVCNYPDKCYCGECPNPDQLEFNLHGASKDWDEDKDDENYEDDSTMEGRMGRCFQLSGRRAIFGGDPGAVLVHGTIQGMGSPPLAHGWVEHSDGTIHEPTTDETFPREIFEAFFNPVVEKRYGQEELRNLIQHHGHWGPWHETKGRI